MKFKFFFIVTFLWTLLFAVPFTDAHEDTTTDEQLTKYYDFSKK